ncbi:MAG: hypothetical protein IPI03_00025 [Rubrivivax sp.]|nr:hypothetical protein [Rubrivivax sp.]MBK7260341.1 hypothetical protein [Rubrivivax sp.]MBK8526014.1 hypothetical protein [Rubrivivax sp.]
MRLSGLGAFALQAAVAAVHAEAARTRSSDWPQIAGQNDARLPGNHLVPAAMDELGG